MSYLSDNPRESARHYIPAGDADTSAMLEKIGLKTLRDLYNHIPAEAFQDGELALPDELGYAETQTKMQGLADKNTIRANFIGDGLPDYSVDPIAPYVCTIRNLATAYTPYQPERSQGTLITHWIYQCALTSLTGFEAINSSLYDRATALFEAICCSLRIARKADTVLVAGNLYPGDIEVLETLLPETDIKVDYIAPNPATGLLDADMVRSRAEALGSSLAAVAFPQVNNLGLLEDVDALTDAIQAAGALAIAVIDPILLADGGLKPPSQYGQKGADILVGEAQHLAIGPNFGGPGLGLFGVRHNDEVKNHVRSTPGRFVGQAKDEAGRDCCVMVMSTREQHIRKDKATSNICSNQAFISTIAGASLIARGDAGLGAMLAKSRELAAKFVASCSAQLAFPNASCLNEVTIVVNNAEAFIEKGRESGLWAGVNVSSRINDGRQLVKLSFTDRQSDEDVAKLAALVGGESDSAIPEVPAALLRTEAPGIPAFSQEQLQGYYQQLGELNVSPDDACYPLGSCTMKYNPALNEWAAGLTGFTDAHPQAPHADMQGCLEVLYDVQEWFKAITGLPAVTTQPVAGAQGELVGLKLFQAYHRHAGEEHRDVVLIPRSAHGTNFATASMAGLATGKIDGKMRGIVLLEDGEDGRIDMEDFDKKLAEYGDRLCGVMITNPNTCGLFETDFKLVADKVHAAGGLVYMDGANMNAIAGWLDLDKLGVDAVHNNLHKTWTIPHGGGGPGDAMVAVSSRLIDFLPGYQIEKQGEQFVPVKPKHSIGSFHRHWGNFAHKIRAYTYLLRLGKDGVRRMSAMSVLASRYLLSRLRERYPTLPAGAPNAPRMHEFILTLSEDDFKRLEAAGVPRALAITRVGKLFLDFGFHAPTVAWPEQFGLMIEPTESYTQAELDRFADAVIRIKDVIEQHPDALNTAPRFTPVDRVDEVSANRQLTLSAPLTGLPSLHENRLSPRVIAEMPVDEIFERVTGCCVTA
ncbi:aminomethyl-transferring glycine dehydrogenase subunit GcvPB [Cerasicoccus fimbriatus]|uniref:aminomethyl-transferring glycine dehydrogenase subunit GcvPB n=1 Tax=Cerasicoccus fimbriatus TaxID=3014554 RepID=UPI0022B56F5B|nr:aminomethyl-transferring glycine dehydrogenase subunit GcvPB [Cerasicoccus sp. TK19100]